MCTDGHWYMALTGGTDRSTLIIRVLIISALMLSVDVASEECHLL
ncbi:unnamed protein product, partial [Staurois parvus]